MANQKQTPPLTRPRMAKTQMQTPGEPAQLLHWRYDDRLFIAGYRKAMQNKQKATFLPPLSLLNFKGKVDFFLKVSSFQRGKQNTVCDEWSLAAVWDRYGT